MSPDVTPAEYRALAELRYRIRHFPQEGGAKARAVGLEPQQCLMLLAIRGLPECSSSAIQTLAERLALKHHSAVELIDRLEAHGYVRRTRSRDDRCLVFVSLLPRGGRLREQVARNRIGELSTSGKTFISAIEALLELRQRDDCNQKKPAKRGARASRA